MIRGKAFEFTVAEKLQGMLEPSVWSITKLQINAQTGLHDIDVQVTHLPTNKTIRLECKLAKKGSCHVDGNYTTILVKCMRSRTLGEEMIERLSPKIGIAKDVLRVHNHAVHLRAAFCDVRCNRVVKRRSLMRPLNALLHRAQRAGGDQARHTATNLPRPPFALRCKQIVSHILLLKMSIATSSKDYSYAL